MQLVLRSRSELDLADQAAVRTSSRANSQSKVYLAAARMGGILANDTHPAQFIQDNFGDPVERHRRGLAQRHAQAAVPGARAASIPGRRSPCRRTAC
ncbi:MAG: hypothetical protein U1F39_06080 [Steroidobacteraceae bacterium]